MHSASPYHAAKLVESAASFSRYLAHASGQRSSNMACCASSKARSPPPSFASRVPVWRAITTRSRAAAGAESAVHKSACPSLRYACANSESATIAVRNALVAAGRSDARMARSPSAYARRARRDRVCSAPAPSIAPGSAPSSESASALNAAPIPPLWAATRMVTSRTGGPPRAASYTPAVRRSVSPKIHNCPITSFPAPSARAMASAVSNGIRNGARAPRRARAS